ncbi:MAG: hypothetical protein ACREA0_01005 [bacterium]
MADTLAKSANSYRVTLGVLVVLGSVEEGWQPVANLQGLLAGFSKSPFVDDPTFSRWLVRARENVDRTDP